MNVQLVRTQVSVWSLGAAIAGLVINAFGLGIVWTNVTNKIDEGDKRSDRMEVHLSAIDTKLVPWDTALFRLQGMEATIPINNKNVNDRLDRIVDSFNGKIEALTVTTNGVAADVKVLLSQKKADLGTTPPSLASR